MAETADMAALASRCRAWQAADLVRATTVDAPTYTPEALEVLRRELDRRNDQEDGEGRPLVTFSSFTPARNPLRGVGGWLAWMVLGIGGQSVQAIVESISFSLSHSFASAVIVVAVDGTLGIFGIYTCVILLRQKPKADRFAMSWFILIAILMGISLLLARGAGPPSRGLSLVYPLLWMAYLWKSERVEATYRAPMEAPVDTQVFQ
jgi:hypothetical protein